MSNIFQKIWAIGVYIFLYLPLVVLILFSFNISKFAVSWKGFTWKWYEKLLSNTGLIDAAINTLVIAFLSATAAVILGTLTALCLQQYRFRGKQVVKSLLFVVMIAPDIVLAISFVVLFIFLGISQGFIALLIAHITFCFPFVAVTVLSRLDGFNKYILDAANDLGASSWQTFRYVVFPMIKPAVFAGWLLSFTLSMDDVIISSFVTGPGYEVLPLKVFSMVKLGVSPEVNALSAIMVVVTIVIVFTAQLLLKEKR